MRYKKLYPAVICFCVFLAAIGLVLGDPSTVLPGLWKIIVTEDALITDYVKIAGVSAALVNSALVTLVSLLLLYLSKEPPNGFTLVAFMHISDHWNVICCFHFFKYLQAFLQTRTTEGF